MKRSSKLFIPVLILFIFSLPVAHAQPPNFHLAFENSLTGNDGETPVSLNAITFEGGIVGQAAHFSDSIDLLYLAGGEISGQQGALEFWIKPSWNGSSGTGNWVMRYGNGGGMLVGSDGVTWRIILNRFGANGLPELGVAVNIGNWVVGEWHHAVFNWSSDRLELFVDGQLLGSQVPPVAPPAITETNLQIGADGSGGFLNGSLDEFRIYPQPLTKQQIESGFCAGFELESIDLQADTVTLLTTWREQAVLTAVTGSGETNLPGSCIDWESSNSAVATVDESGLIRGLAPGQADILASIGGLQTQMLVEVMAPLRAPEEESIDPYLATPAVDKLWEIPVVILRYLPTTDGINVDSETTGYVSDLEALKSQIDVYTNRVKFMLEEGSRFRGYKNNSARPSIGYRVIDVITVFEEFQKGFEVAWNPGWYRPDFNQILERFDGRHYVEDLGVKEFWIWGYHYAGLEPTESNMSSPLTGDVSNSLRYNDDMPIYSKTYTVYNYNFTRTQAEAVHNHEHQLESILSHANWLQDGNADLFWNEFTGRNDQGAVTGRCGNAHMPPNTTTDYDYQNFTVVLSDCEDWQPGGGQQKEVSALTWQNLIYDWPDDNFIPQKTESQYYIYWMQNMPGFDNQIPYVEEQMANWWYFTADWDSAITNNYGLYNVFQINPGLNDAWYFPDTDGQGFFITVFPDIGYVSLSWFTYDTERPDNGVTANLGEPGHRWLMALGQYHGNRAEMDISITSGGVFDTPTEVTEVTDGTIILTFADCTSGTVEYDIPSIGRKGTVPIQRVVGDNIAFCESYAGQASTLQTGAKNRTDNNHTYSYDTPVTTADTAPLGNMNVGLNDAWYYPVTNGQGFFINVFPDIGYVSLSWFTYETERPPEDVTTNLGEPGHRWLMALGTYSGNQALMDISITSGGIFDTPTEVAEVNDGTIILTFTDCENGMVEYDIPSIDRKGVVPIQRVVGDNVALCEALNTD